MGLALLLVMLMAAPAQALPVDGLYRFELPVENQSDAERRRAYREALSAVLLKVTGDQRWLQDPLLQSALNNAQSYVQEVGFRTGSRQVAAPPADNDGDALAEAPMVSVPTTFISVRFSSDAIDDLLDSANIPIWDRNRPSVLVWLSVQDSSGRRTLLGSDSEHQIVEIIRQFSQRRGLPLLIPMLDLTDRRNVPADRAWDLDQQAIRLASERYGVDSILSGRLLITPNDDLVGLWQFLFKDSVDTFDGFDQDLERYLEAALDRVTAQLASHYSIVRNTLQSNDRVLLRIDDIRDIASHHTVVSYVRDLSVVRHVAVSRLSPNSLELLVDLSGSRDHFADFINLGRDLQPVADEAGEPDLLHYRWTR